MTIQQLADFYMKHWWQDSYGKWHLADNAPPTLWRFVFSLPKHTDRSMIHSALRGLATQEAPKDPTREELLLWLTSNPAAFDRCNAILSDKKAKILSFEKMLEKAYNSELFDITDELHKFFKQEINK